jgi:uncharacterized phosphosugar-binding protein
MTITDRYLEHVVDAVRRIQETQREAIQAAGHACARSIAGDGLAFTFGTGHGSFAALECFPRTGTPVGFRPIVESAIANFHHVLGDQGAYQYRFLHALEGYGRAILRAHRLDPGDTMVLFSHSGINAVIMDMALGAHEVGMTVVGVTSVPHSSAVPARHSSGRPTSSSTPACRCATRTSPSRASSTRWGPHRPYWRRRSRTRWWGRPCRSSCASASGRT